MRYTLLILLTILPLLIFSQDLKDTVIVQVFTFDTPSPPKEKGNAYKNYEGMVQFPEDNSQWGKVLMVMKLKCDSATARDEYPCGEWDALTPTSLYVPDIDTVEKYQLISFVTPYGYQLEMGGDNGWTWIFDVTDYLPILKGEMKITAGNNQELLDLKFIFIKGVAPRTPLTVENLYPVGSYRYEYLATDSLLKARKISLNKEASSFMLRARISGHGHKGPHNCCEWDNKLHTYNIGEWKQFKWNVWKDCGFNPIYPQGGTWPFDRAGWCPGAAVDENDFELGNYAFPGDTVSIDYSIEMYKNNGEKKGNFFMSHQLFSYGPPNFKNDAAILDILAPSSADEHSRINPICAYPRIIIQNTGEHVLKSLQIEYGLSNGKRSTFTWRGHLEFLEKEELWLPIPGWKGLSKNQDFHVEILESNGIEDDYLKNNVARSRVSLPVRFPSDFIVHIMTNNLDRAKENSYTISKASGELVYSKDNFMDSTLYHDKIHLKDGCYELRFTDRNEDGMLKHWWERKAKPGQVGINGDISIRSLDGKVLYPLPFDFGQEILLNFRVGTIE
jgi:hypothetical protein